MRVEVGLKERTRRPTVGPLEKAKVRQPRPALALAALKACQIFPKVRPDLKSFAWYPQPHPNFYPLFQPQAGKYRVLPDRKLYN